MKPLARFPLQEFRELTVLRPLLSLERGALREYLAARGERWREDPMNADPRFDRARLRLHWHRLEEIGLTASRVADAASHLSRVREALDEVTVAVLSRA